MTQQEFIADNLARGLGLLSMTLADFSDADMLIRPVPGANHALYQLGHLVVSETGLLAACGAAMPELPPGLADKFNAKTATLDDPAAFPKKADLLAHLEKVRAATIAFAKSCPDADLAKPGPERMRTIAPTVAHTLALIVNHAAMHVGQFQVIRRKLGKPNLF